MVVVVSPAAGAAGIRQLISAGAQSYSAIFGPALSLAADWLAAQTGVSVCLVVAVSARPSMGRNTS